VAAVSSAFVRGGNDVCSRAGAASGAVAIGLFVAGALVIGERPDFDATGAQHASFFEGHRDDIRLGAALDAAAAPFLVWFLATVAALARGGGDDNRQRRAATVAFGCGLVFVALFLADITSLVAGAMRPGHMTEHPELATTLVDFEWLAMGVAAPVVVMMLLAFAALSLRDRVIWPRWAGALAVLAAAAYGLRVGTLFETGGDWAADGLLGLYVPVGALTGWLVVASVTLALRRR
jgi:hypothetical protein